MCSFQPGGQQGAVISPIFTAAYVLSREGLPLATSSSYSSTPSSSLIGQASTDSLRVRPQFSTGKIVGKNLFGVPLTLNNVDFMDFLIFVCSATLINPPKMDPFIMKAVSFHMFKGMPFTLIQHHQLRFYFSPSVLPDSMGIYEKSDGDAPSSLPKVLCASPNSLYIR
ncbi:hypothetical protein Scep_006899 [Stephania cephalantha]|uniref:Uncharacterized protein n=1 Tax=Stephania cephalantha TaxID=152367 RepID=A0AAP0KBD5_9MAGN